MTLPIDHIIQSVHDASAANPCEFTIQLSDSWHQGRTVYGGIMTAVLLEAISERIGPDRILTSISVNFVGPQDGEQPINIATSIIREGKSVTQATAQSTQNGSIGTSITACFAKARPSEVHVESSESPSIRPASHCFNVPKDSDVAPKFLQYIDLAVSDGDLPFSNSQKSTLAGWMKYAEAPSKMTMSHLVGLIDAWPPAVLQMMPKPGPASTISWHLTFPNQIENSDGTEWLGYQATTQSAADGYAHTLAKVYSPKGKLLAISQQTIAIFG